MAQFFIDRPIFAWVIALFIVVGGAVSITQLPVAQYPHGRTAGHRRHRDLSGRVGARRWKTACSPSSSRR